MILYEHMKSGADNEVIVHYQNSDGS